jgi:hypothetical protein
MENIQVAIRIRPFLEKEKENEDNTLIQTTGEDDRKIQLSKGTKVFKGYFDKIFFPNSTQEQVYNYIRVIFSSLFKGINSTILAYGQTGSGKTYTMFGAEWTFNFLNNNLNRKIIKDEFNFLIDKDFILDPFSSTNGIIPRIIFELFDIINKEKKNEKIKISCSYIQVYNERIYDLLIDNTFNYKKREFTMNSNKNQSEKIFDQQPLKLRDDNYRGVIIEGALEILVNTFYDIFQLLRIGELNRKKRQTNKNDMSSRSHTIFIIYYTNLTQQLTSKICLCDLAGSEKYNNRENYKITHFNELKSINKSLSALGSVIHALSSKKKKIHIPYKDSKLTHLLQNSLGGNSKTFLIANISPCDFNFDESYNTLLFAERAQNVESKIIPNKYIDDDFISKNNSEENKTILRLTNEIKELRQILQLRNKRGTLEPIQEEFIKLKEENNQLKKYVNNINNNDMVKLIQENEFLKNQIRKLTFGNNNNNNYFNNNFNNEYNNNNYSNNTSNYNSESSNYSNKNLNTPSIKSVNQNKYQRYNIIDYKDNNILSRVGNSIVNNNKSDRSQSVTKKNPNYNSYFDLNIEPSNFKYNNNNNIHTFNNNNKKNNSNKNNINSKLIEMTNKKLKILDELQMKNRYQTQQMINALRNKSFDNKKNNYNFPKSKMERELGLEFD